VYRRGRRGARSAAFISGFPTRDLGTVALLICYDLVIPETARALALQERHHFLSDDGGAAMGEDDIACRRCAFERRKISHGSWSRIVAAAR
jgi:hypothetical protein